MEIYVYIPCLTIQSDYPGREHPDRNTPGDTATNLDPEVQRVAGSGNDNIFLLLTPRDTSINQVELGQR